MRTLPTSWRSSAATIRMADRVLTANAGLDEGYRFALRVSERGTVASVGDGICWVRGLPSARLDELIGFDDGSTGLVFQLDRDLLGAIQLIETR